MSLFEQMAAITKPEKTSEQKLARYTNCIGQILQIIGKNISQNDMIEEIEATIKTLYK